MEPMQRGGVAGGPSPCAACRTFKKSCPENCVFAPYFPSNDLHQFAVVHKIFGARNIAKLLKELPREQGEDAVRSMVYEVNERIRDPGYGCAGVISHMQSQLSELQSELERAAHVNSSGVSSEIKTLDLFPLSPGMSVVSPSLEYS